VRSRTAGERVAQVRGVANQRHDASCGAQDGLVGHRLGCIRAISCRRVSLCPCRDPRGKAPQGVRTLYRLRSPGRPWPGWWPWRTTYPHGGRFRPIEPGPEPGRARVGDPEWVTRCPRGAVSRVGGGRVQRRSLTRPEPAEAQYRADALAHRSFAQTKQGRGPCRVARGDARSGQPGVPRRARRAAARCSGSRALTGAIRRRPVNGAIAAAGSEHGSLIRRGSLPCSATPWG
jgi:hypothetical protein